MYLNFKGFINSFTSSLFNKLFSLFNWLASHLWNCINFIKTHLFYATNFFEEYKFYFTIIFISFFIYKIGSFVWQYRNNLSKFLLFPEPLLRGVWFHIFNNFYKNSVSDGLLELEKLISTLPNRTPIIIVIGQQDYIKNITTLFKGDDMSWYYLRDSIYLYIHNIEQVKYIASFLNRIKPDKPINSVILKIIFNDQGELEYLDNNIVITEALKDIASITGIKAPLYLNILNVPWLKENSQYLRDEEYIGFLFDGWDTMAANHMFSNLANLRLALFDKMLSKQIYNSHFWSQAEQYNDTIVQYLLLLSKQDINIVRGLFFTIDKEKSNINQLLRVEEESDTLFLNFHKEVVEQEVFLGDTIDIKYNLLPRYMKYKNSLFAIYMSVLALFVIRINHQILMFNNQYTEYATRTENILANVNNKTGYNVYELIKTINKLNLNGVNYFFLPHNYLVDDFYEQLCEIEEILTLNLIQQQMDNSNILAADSSVTSYEQLRLFIKKILDLENVIFNNQQVKRFGIYKTRNNATAYAKSKIFLEKSFTKIRSMYFILLDQFLKDYFKDSLENLVKQFQNKILYLFRGDKVGIEHIKHILNSYYDLKAQIIATQASIELQELEILNIQIERSIMFGAEVAKNTSFQIKNLSKSYINKLTNIKNNITGSILTLDDKQKLVFTDKILTIIQDLERFINEPVMGNTRDAEPVLPDKDLISTWDVAILSDTVKTRNQATDFQKNLDVYSPDLRNILLTIFKKKVASSIFSKIGISQSIMPKEYVNLQNTLDAFTYINILLQFFLETGNTDYYNKTINIFLHDFKIIDNHIEDLLSDTIFFQYKNIQGLNRDNVLEFLFSTNNIDKIREIVNHDIDKFIRIFHSYIEPVYKILNYEHFAKFRSTQYVKYQSINLDVQKYQKGINNSFNRFLDMVMNTLTKYSIYDSFNEGEFVYDDESEEIYLLSLLNRFKRGLIKRSQQLYNEEVLLFYSSFYNNINHFMKQFPFNKHFDRHNVIMIDKLYEFLQANNKMINLFKKRNSYTDKLGVVVYQISGLYNNIHKDGLGYYFKPKIELNVPDTYAIHSAYVGLVNINQTQEYSPYLVQQETKLYFHLPVYLHVEVVENNQIKLQKITSDYYSTEITSKGIRFFFPTIWHFINFVYQHRELGDEISKIQILVALPVKVNDRIHNIKFNILFENFLFFPTKIPFLPK